LVVVPDGPSTRFLAGVDKWVAGLGRLRDLVRQEVLAAQLSEVLVNRGLSRGRVLDVGCGQGTQALLLARAGHEVTGLDISPDLLARFELALASEAPEVQARVLLMQGQGEAAEDLVAGPFDLILCHGVLPYLDDATPILGALSRVAAKRAAISVLVRNGHAMAMRPGLQGKWAEAVSAFDDLGYVNRLGLAARAHTPEDLDPILNGDGWQRHGWYGVRVFTDHREGEALPALKELSLLLATEHEAGRRDPYRQVAALLHIIYTRD